jgi:hypothetical protein
MSTLRGHSYLTLREAVKSAGIPENYFKNYVFKGGELKVRKIDGRWMISRQEFDQWKKNRDFKLMKLGIEDYFNAFNFAVKQFYRGGLVIVEWGKTKRREIGEFLFNQIGGKLGELAFRKFLHDRFDIDVRISFELEKEIPGQDIFEVAGRSPKIKVSIKTTKIQNFNLWVVEEEIDLSDAYVLCRVDLPLDHLLRAFREHEKLSTIRDVIPELGELEAEVVGFAWKDELKAKGPTTKMVGADGEVVQELRRPQYVMLSGELRKSKDDWQRLVNAL